jgi:hypothetical protein
MCYHEIVTQRPQCLARRKPTPPATLQTPSSLETPGAPRDAMEQVSSLSLQRESR